jgi:glycerophosphoryl diester phosphodiesterase
LTDIFAHRGSAQAARENTLEAFAAARELGADGVELDVHLSRDGFVVVHHDPEVPGRGQIAFLSRSELPPWLPGLEEALEICRPLSVNVEIKADPKTTAKPDELVAKVAAILADRDDEVPRIIVSSFSLTALDAFLALAPSVPTAVLLEPADDPRAALRTAHEHRHKGLHPFFPVVDEALVTAAHGVEVAIRPWTVDNPTQIAQLAEMGVDAIITNDVQLALRAIGRC